MASNLEVAQHLQAKHLSDILLCMFSEWHSYDIFNYVYVGKHFFWENRLSQCKLQGIARKGIYRGSKSRVSYVENWILTKIIQNGLDAPQPLDDVGEYIDYINQHCQAIKVSLGPAFLFLKNVVSAPGQFWREIIPHAF